MSDDGRRTGAVALITGASHGIGLDIARQLRQRAMTVLLTARSQRQADDAAHLLASEGLAVTPMAVDVADQASVDALRERVESEQGQLDVLINNAAGYVDWSETASQADLRATHDLFEVNVFGVWRMSQAFLPMLKASAHGRLVNVASGSGSHGDMDFGLTTNNGAAASYGISKAAVIALTSKLAAEVDGSSLLVNAVCPGLTATAPGMESMGARPIPEGAASIVWAALLPDNGPNGGFLRDGKPLPW